MRKSIVISVLCLDLITPAFASDANPRQQIDALYQQIVSDKSATAFQDFFAGGLLATQKPAELKSLDSQAKGAFDFYGKPVSFEFIEEKKIGKSLVRLTWLTRQKDDIPLFWSATFYLRNSKWEPFNVLFFDSPEKAGL
jgi:hypothetical protein